MKKIFCVSIVLFSLFGVRNVFASSVSMSNYITDSVLIFRYDDEVLNGGAFQEETVEQVSGVSLDQNYCEDEDFIKPFIFLGRIFSIIKIIIPILIIVFGMIDFFKAVIASKDEEIKKAMKSLLLRAIAGVVIFFIPTIIHLIFLLVDDWKEYDTTYSKCSLCITSPGKCTNKETSDE